MTAQFEGVEDATPDEPKGEVQYVVQMAIKVEAVDGEIVHWYDVATVTVPVGTKRKTVLRQALAGMEVGEQAPRLRALDVGSAEVFEPEAETTTKWVI